MKALILLSAIFAFNAMSKVKLNNDPTIKFTGFKFTEKVAVSGTFTTIEWNYPEGKSIEDILEKATFKIDSYSVDAGKKARNVNIRNGLFKNWGGRFIEGKTHSLDSRSQVIKILIKIGEEQKAIPFKYVVEGNKVTLQSNIDLLKMGFEKAFGKLGKLCAVHHKGKDGKIKTWSEVDLEVTAEFSNL